MEVQAITARGALAPRIFNRNGFLSRKRSELGDKRLILGPVTPFVWCRASRNTTLSVNTFRIASGEYIGCPPRPVRGDARQAVITSSMNQIVKLPR